MIDVKINPEKEIENIRRLVEIGRHKQYSTKPLDFDLNLVLSGMRNGDIGIADAYYVFRFCAYILVETHQLYAIKYQAREILRLESSYFKGGLLRAEKFGEMPKGLRIAIEEIYGEREYTYTTEILNYLDKNGNEKKKPSVRKVKGFVHDQSAVQLYYELIDFDNAKEMNARIKKIKPEEEKFLSLAGCFHKTLYLIRAGELDNKPDKLISEINNIIYPYAWKWMGRDGYPPIIPILSYTYSRLNGDWKKLDECDKEIEDQTFKLTRVMEIIKFANGLRKHRDFMVAAKAEGVYRRTLYSLDKDTRLRTTEALAKMRENNQPSSVQIKQKNGANV